jgi:hypothetical protein
MVSFYGQLASDSIAIRPFISSLPCALAYGESDGALSLPFPLAFPLRAVLAGAGPAGHGPTG